MVCTFFGHKDTPKEIEPTLRSTLIDLIENKNVNVFYVAGCSSTSFFAEKIAVQVLPVPVAIT